MCARYTCSGVRVRAYAQNVLTFFSFFFSVYTYQDLWYMSSICFELFLFLESFKLFWNGSQIIKVHATTPHLWHTTVFIAHLGDSGRNGARAHCVMVSNFQWKPFWLATQRDPQNDWTATQNRVNNDVFAHAPFVPLPHEYPYPGKSVWRVHWTKNNIKFSSLSAPTKIEELTAGSDEKNTAQPRRESNQGLASSSRTLKNRWATKPQRELRVNSRLSS